MSRIGRKPVELLDGAKAEVVAKEVVVRGPKGELKVLIPSGIAVKVEENQVIVEAKNQENQTKANHGLVRSLIANCVEGVTKGYKKTLKLVGTGYRVATKGAGIELAVGLSHKVDVTPRAGVKLSIEGNDTIHIEGIDKQSVGQQSAEIRAIKPPEPYLGKGIRYEDEVIIKKQGKTAA
ncbi:MAG: 50S ribosomal protein L6 [Candidatus Pacebacteria bacterium]|nr:50S ribosomal protein L6 [Candidatus Paceibacterota bacterium]